MGSSLRGGLVAERASFELSKDYERLSRGIRIAEAALLLLNLSIAHCSNCSRVISTVGGIS